MSTPASQLSRAGRRRTTFGATAVAAVAIAGGAFAVAEGGSDHQAGAEGTLPSTSLLAVTEAAPSTTSTTVDPAAELEAWYDSQDDAGKLAFNLFTGGEEAWAAFAEWVTPVPEPEPAPAPAPEPVPLPVPAPAPAPAPAPTPAPAAAGGGTGNAFLECVKHRESRGNYSAVNSSSGAGGAYQFLQSTWNNTVANAGRGDLVGVHPSQASPADQDAMALHLLAWQGRSPWAGGGC